MVAIGIAYLVIKAGWIVVNTEGTFLLLVLVFGAGTDYSLLLVHRYREELQGGRPPAEALPLALRETRPAVAASGGTVIAAMLVLLVADLQSTHWLGPILAIGIAVMVCSAFTLLPALLAVLGERAFWPARGGRRGATGRAAGRRSRGSCGAARGRSSAPSSSASSSSPPATSSTTARSASARARRKPTNSSEGTKVLNEHFPPGLASPLTAVVPAGEAAQVTRAMREPRLGPPGDPGPGRRASFESAVVVAHPRRQPLLGRSGRRGREGSANACTRSRRAACSAASRRRTGTSSRPTAATPA